MEFGINSGHPQWEKNQITEVIELLSQKKTSERLEGK